MATPTVTAPSVAPKAPVPPAAAAAPPAPPAPLTGELVDQGAVRRDSVRALRWTASGAAKILGDVEVATSELSGLISIKGRLLGGSASSNGSLDVGGAVTLTGQLTTAGETVFRGPVQAGSVDAAGSTRCASTLTSMGPVRWTGRLELGGDLKAGPLEFEGRLQTPGEVRATSIEGRLRGGRSEAAALRADRVVLRRLGRFGSAGALTVFEIEGQQVEIEGVTVERIRAQNVVIGPGCQVAYIEGAVASVHRTSHVGPVSQSPRPYGLVR